MLRAVFVLILSGFLIAGCGGGGGSNSGGNGGGGTTNTPPTVTATTPVSAATGVAVTSTVTATFSEAMNGSTITSSTFTLTAQSGASVSGAVTYAGQVATFTPNASLSYGTTYTATITTGAQSAQGAALSANDSWSFTTVAAPAPTVTAATPANASTGVAIGTSVTVTFNEAMNASTITGSTFTLTGPGGATITGIMGYDATTFIASLVPSVPLANNTTYTATITTGVQSAQGAALAANYTWSFTTIAVAQAAPTVTAVTPAASATGVAVNTSVTATFSEAMNAATITSSTFMLTAQGGGAVAGSVAYSSGTSTATFDPASNLAYGTTYTATITTAATSSTGTALAANYTWTFTTVEQPTVAATTPSNAATNVPVGQALTATFSQQMNSSTITASTFTLSAIGGAAVAGVVSYSTATAIATFTPNTALASGTEYTATITTGAQSLAGVALTANYAWTFTTAANPNQVTVNFGTTYQTIRGFGGSTAWLGAMPTAVATALFSPTSGLGLNILRVRIDPEGSASGGGKYGDPYETGEWDYELTNGEEAVAANPNAIVFATPWTPPAAWKLSGSSSLQDDGETWNQSFNTCAEGTGYCGGYLASSFYADYASYLEDFVTFFDTNSGGTNLYAISMQNEPEENVTYESCVWTPEEMDTWVANDASAITSDAHHTKLIMPESDVFNPVDAATTLNDSNAQGLVSIIGGHIYQLLSGGSIAPYSIPAGDTPKELWMTEFGPLSTAAPTWAEAVTTYAESIHNSMVTGQYNAYVWWGLFGESAGSCATAAGTCGLVDNAGNVTVTGEVVGQFSKFIQPGYVRVSATNPVSGVYVSAYMNASPAHYVIVAINTNTSSESLSFSLSGNASSVTSLTPYQSTSTAGLAAQPAVSVVSGQFSYTLPAQSIVTFVQ
jgi:O-glycosyl hydrolase